jgi:hypothetical protein
VVASVDKGGSKFELCMYVGWVDEWFHIGCFSQVAGKGVVFQLLVPVKFACIPQKEAILQIPCASRPLLGKGPPVYLPNVEHGWRRGTGSRERVISPQVIVILLRYYVEHDLGALKTLLHIRTLPGSLPNYQCRRDTDMCNLPSREEVHRARAESLETSP